MDTEVVETFEEEAQFVETAPAPIVSAELPDIKLFGRWSCDEVQVSDMSLQVSQNTRWILQKLMIISLLGLYCRERKIRSLFTTFGRTIRCQAIPQSSMPDCWTSHMLFDDEGT